MDISTYEKIQSKAASYLGYKMLTEYQLREKLNSYFKTEIDENSLNCAIDEIILKFKEYSYIDDLKYTKAYIENCIAIRPRGKYLIRYELSQKGIDKNTIETVLNSFDEEIYIEMLKRVIEKKSRNTDLSDKRVRSKLYKHLLSKGFSYDEIDCNLKDDES